MSRHSIMKKIRTKESDFLPEPFKRSLRGYTKSYRLPVVDKLDPLSQLGNSRGERHTILQYELGVMKGLKFVETLEITFEKPLNEDTTTHKTATLTPKLAPLLMKSK